MNPEATTDSETVGSGAEPARFLVPCCDRFGLGKGEDRLQEERLVLCYTPRDEHPRFLEFDYIIYHLGCFRGGGDYPDRLLEIEREIRQAFARARTWLCLVFDEYWKGDVRLDKDSDPALRVLFDTGVTIQELDMPSAKLAVCREEFAGLLGQYGQHKAYFEAGPGVTLAPIAKHPDSGRVTGFHQGRFVVVPVRFLALGEDGKREVHRRLAAALHALRARHYAASPQWAAEPFFAGESDARRQLAEAEAAVLQLERQVRTFERDKAALWLGDTELEDEVERVLRDEFGLAEENGYGVERIQDCTADMWLLHEGEKKALLEVKSADKSARKPHVHAAAGHRTDHELGDDFPVVLVINPLMAQTLSIADKRTEISRNVVKAAVDADVVILRTIDLLDALKLLRSGELTRDAFFESLRGQHGTGWLVVEKDEVRVRPA